MSQRRYTQAEVIEYLQREKERVGGLIELAKKLDVSHQHLRSVLVGRQLPNENFGFRKSVIFTKVGK